MVTASWLECVKTSNPWVVKYPGAMNLKGRNNTPRPGSESFCGARKTGSQLEEVFRDRECEELFRQHNVARLVGWDGYR